MDFAQTLQEMQQNVDNINGLIGESGPLAIQKIYSTHHIIFLSCRAPGRSIILGLGRGGGYEGLWISPQMPLSENRTKDRYLEYLRKNVKGRTLTELKLVGKDRILEFYIRKKNEEALFSIFFLGRKSYFSYQKRMEGGRVQFFSGHHNKNQEVVSSDFIESFDDISRNEMTTK